MTDRGRGRPPIGDRVSVRFPPETQGRIDALAAEHGVSRAEMIRRLIEQALTHQAARDAGGDPPARAPR